MFENSTLIKLMHPSGVNFIERYQGEIKKAIARKCRILILLATPESRFAEELDGIWELKEKRLRTIAEEIKDVYKIIRDINEKIPKKIVLKI
jgi:hypothetical protein